MDYKRHTQERYKERFIRYHNILPEISDEDYYIMCIIGRDDNQGYFLKNKNKSKKKIIFYNNIPFCCIITRKSKVVKTIYPVKKSILKKLNI